MNVVFPNVQYSCFFCSSSTLLDSVQSSKHLQLTIIYKLMIGLLISFSSSSFSKMIFSVCLHKSPPGLPSILLCLNPSNIEFMLLGAAHKVRHAIFGQFLPPPFPRHPSPHIPGSPPNDPTQR